MKKTILAVLFVFAVIFLANSYAQGAQVILPDPNAKLSETVNIEPLTEPLVIRPFEYQIRRGDNLTKLARTFGTTVDELLDYNPGVKNKNLILAGGKLRVPLYSTESVENLVGVVSRNEGGMGYEKGRDELWPYVIGLLLAFVTLFIFFVGVLFFNVRLKHQADEAKDKLKTLETEFAHVHMKLGLAHEQLKLKEGADEEIKRLKMDNDRLVEKVSTLYMDNKMISVNLADAQAKREAMEKQLKLMPGQLVGLDSQEHGKILVKILKLETNKEKEGELDVFVECPKQDCLVNVVKNLKAQNALSHMASSGHWSTSS